LHTELPRVLDLGAGEGSATLPFLELGAKVMAVDISGNQLATLSAKCEPFKNSLEVRCEDIHAFLKDKRQEYDVIIANSFLHHVPDYVGMIKEALPLLSHYGHFFSFQDPLRYDTVGMISSGFSRIAYFSWRIRKGDLIGGLRRRRRRARGMYFEDSVADNVEYHAIRNGVDQSAICKLLREENFDCKVFTYFSTQSPFFQMIGRILGIKNTFALVAEKHFKKGV
jgi:SAM-dependent methyltransferase